ncbi:DUF3768 domain-containing protein [Sphingomonas glacialis]|uniref:DUF3768 domain-containing protein n=1 Tax=Sphingomonas glacialis TaxID=658225 RepID=UPI00321F6586
MPEQTRHSDRSKRGVRETTRLNDWLREHITAPGNNRVVMTRGIAELLGDVSLFRGWRNRAQMLREVRDFVAFDYAINPHGERDMGKFEFADIPCYWKIEHYNQDLASAPRTPPIRFRPSASSPLRSSTNDDLPCPYALASEPLITCPKDRLMTVETMNRISAS